MGEGIKSSMLVKTFVLDADESVFYLLRDLV